MTEHPSVALEKTRDLVNEIEKRLNATTEGPWFREYSDVISLHPDPRDEHYDDPRNLRVSRGPDHLDRKDRQGIANADFFAHCKTDVPFLIALVRRQAEQIANVRELTAEIGAGHDLLNLAISRNLRRALGDEIIALNETDTEDDDD